MSRNRQRGVGRPEHFGKPTFSDGSAARLAQLRLAPTQPVLKPTGGWLGQSVKACEKGLADALASLPPFERQPEAPLSPARSEAVTRARARQLASSKYRIALSETGAGQFVADALVNARPNRASSVVAALGPYDRGATVRRYGAQPTTNGLDPHTNSRHLQAQLQVEYDALGRDGARRLVFASTAKTGHDAGHAWIGVMGAFGPGGAASSAVLHVKLLARKTLQQRKELGQAGVNLLYAAMKHRDDPAAFYGSLREGISAANLQIDQIQFTGEGFSAVSRDAGVQLLNHGLTDVLVARRGGAHQAPQGMSPLKSPFFLRDLPVTPVEQLGSTELGWHIVTADAHLAPPSNSVQHDANEALRDRLRPSHVQVTRSDALRSIPEGLSPTQRKAHEVNLAGSAQGTILEVGHGKGVSSSLFKAPFSGTVFESAYLDAPHPTWSGLELTRANLNAILDKAQANLPRKPGVRQFTLVRLPGGEQLGRRVGWFALRAERKVGEPPEDLLLRFTHSLKESGEALGTLGINLLHGFFNQGLTGEPLKRALLDALPADVHLEALTALERRE